jgi:hypothetical protein
MAVSVDTVYQTVLALANKEQRGYITPQEFNLFANHAQMDIFEQYFYDLNQFKRIPGNQSDYADIVSNIQDKIDIFIAKTDLVFDEVGSSIELPDDFYRTSVVSGDGVNAEHVSREQHSLHKSPLIAPTKSRPIFYLWKNTIAIRPIPSTGVLSYIRKPKAPNWTYLMIADKAMWNPDVEAGMQHFELHPSEEQNLVIKILKLAGVSIKDLGLAQLAGQEEINNLQQEKA